MSGIDPAEGYRAPWAPAADDRHLAAPFAVVRRVARAVQLARMRAARTAALRALSTPTHATGTPGGIWAIDRSASSPPATEVRLVSGTPITGRSEWAATTPGSAADSPAPAMITRRPRIRAFLA